MINLCLERYCEDCPEFKPEVEKNVVYDGTGSTSCHTNIYCKHEKRCRKMIKYLKENK